MVVMMSVWLPYDVVLTFPKERQIFLRERKSGLYTSGVFYLARIFADMPMHVISATIMALITYPMAGLRMGLHFFILLNVFGILVGASMMQCIGAMCRTFEEANILMMFVMLLSMMMSTGFVREVPGWLSWMREISVMGLVGDMCMYLEFRDIDPKYGGTPQQIYYDYGVRIDSDEDVMIGVWILISIFMVVRILTFLAVKFMHTSRSFHENLKD